MQKLTTGPLKAKSALLIVALALAVGISYDRLVIDQAIGVGFAFTALLFVASVWVMCMRRRTESAILLAGAALLLAWSMLRAAEYLIAIDVVAAGLLIALAVTAFAYDPRVWLLGVFNHVASLFDQFISAAAGAVRPLTVLSRSKRRLELGLALPYVRGAAIALPVFALFALLLSSADSVFSGFLTDLVPDLHFSLGNTVGHLAVISLFAWVTAGYLAFAWETPHAVVQGAAIGDERPRRDHFVEAMIVLCSVAALFALFVIFQFAYLFRGQAQIHNGMTYAEYARHGFFQLLAVSALTAMLVWVAMLWLRPLTGTRRALFRMVCTLMVLLTGVILASALKRLGLYEQAYGYTRLRLLSHVFTFWIAGVLVVLLAQVYVEREGILPVGAVALGFVVLFGLNLINPDAWIAGRNLDRIDQLSPAGDLYYVAELSEDAVSATIDRFPRLTPRQRTQMSDWICGFVVNKRRWREWNLGASRAYSAAEGAGITSDSIVCRT